MAEAQQVPPIAVRPQAGGPASAPGPARTKDSVTDLVIRWATRATVAGIAVSVIAHIIFLIASGAITFGGGGAPAGTRPTGPIEVATMTVAELRAIEEMPVSTLTPGVDEPDPNARLDLSATPSLESAGGQSVPGTGDLGGTGDGLGGAGNGLGIGVGDGLSGGAGEGARFFGVEARGQRFIYIVDISGSMAEVAAEDNPPKIDILKRELVTSLEALADGTQFIIYPFETDTRPLLSSERWLVASEKNKKTAIDAVRLLTAGGGTNPSNAFTSAFLVKPRPDAIYFMTDGIFDEGIAVRIAALNRTEPQVPIHTIAFGDNAAFALMQRIAKDSGGTYLKVGTRR
jgi:hypothetical protein